MIFSSLNKRPRATVGGLFAVALAGVVLLCGAGSVPVENFLPQGAMQGDLNAGGHSLTNAATVNAANLIATGSLTPPASFTLPFSKLTSTPTTISGYGIADAVTLTGTQTLTNKSISSGQITGLGSGVPAILASAPNAAGGLITYDPVLAKLSAPPPGSVFNLLGESLAAGIPIINVDGGGNQISYAGPGQPWAQQLSAMAGWTTTPIYDYAISASTSASAASVLVSSSNHGTEYLNGAVVGSIGGIATAPSAHLATGIGKTYWANTYDGHNDFGNGISVATYSTNMLAMWATERGYGANPVIIGVTSQATPFTSQQSMEPYNSWTRSQWGQSTGVNTVADIAETFQNPYDTNFYSFAAPGHFVSQGCFYYALDVANAVEGRSPPQILTGASSQYVQAIVPSAASGSSTSVTVLNPGLFNPALGIYSNLASGQYLTLNIGKDQGIHDNVQATWFQGSSNATCYGTFNIPGTSGGLYAFGNGDTVVNSSADDGTAVQLSGTTEIKGGGALKLNTTQTTVNGSSAGSVIFAEPEQGTAQKEVLAYCNALTGTASFTFPSAFTATPVVLNTSGLASSLVTTLTTTGMTVTGTSSTGPLIVEGY